jgi:predicted RNA-binding Zn-ribbon protein involved in translation (DUF1610 family)
MEMNWWMCTGCGVDAEIAPPAPQGCEQPCPDCGEDMQLWLQWDAVAA